MFPIKLAQFKTSVTPQNNITTYYICCSKYYLKALIETVNEIKQRTFATTLDWVPVPASVRDHAGQNK
jgi:hypothetical protein